MLWQFLHPDMTGEHLGFIPFFLSEEDERSAKEQIHAKYVSGWNKFDGFKLDKQTGTLSYPGDPPMHPIAMTSLRDELIMFYDHSWLLILQKDGSWEAARLD